VYQRILPSAPLKSANWREHAHLPIFCAERKATSYQGVDPELANKEKALRQELRVKEDSKVSLQPRLQT
jgi:hypothetical protein